MEHVKIRAAYNVKRLLWSECFKWEKCVGFFLFVCLVFLLMQLFNFRIVICIPYYFLEFTRVSHVDSLYLGDVKHNLNLGDVKHSGTASECSDEFVRNDSCNLRVRDRQSETEREIER